MFDRVSAVCCVGSGITDWSNGVTQVDEPVLGTGQQPAMGHLDLEQVQRRTVRTLLASQMAGGIGLVSGYSVTALLADDITGSKTLAGLAAASLSIGAAIASFPLARLMARSGRRPGLLMGYVLAAIGGFFAVLAAITRQFAFLPVGVALIGIGNATNMATRYAAADLAKPERRASTIGLVVAATTIGSGFGSLVSLSVFDPIGRSIGLPDYAGSFLTGALLFLVAAAIVEIRLRPDPLVLAGGVGSDGTDTRIPFGAAMGLILANPKARLAVIAMMVSQATMVGTMTLTPLHMNDGGQSNGAISIMLFSHILGMYAFSPLVGRLADQVGRYPMLLLSGVLVAAGALWAGFTPPEGFIGITGGQTVIGIAWCFGIIAASGLLTEAFPVEQRASVQGAGDMCMMAFGAVAGISAGAIVAYRSYLDLNLAAAILGAALVIAVLLTVISTGRTGKRGQTIFAVTPVPGY
ncbi:MAG: MFS transporter [Acidimicrobiaceae bacterium]|nr:MFS transporter [Acidimicrobiaceae bacterium]